jgi:hypothetical protein
VPGRFRLETLKPVRPAFGLEPRPVAPSSRISPPAPVEAPGNGEIAVGVVVRLDLHQHVRHLAPRFVERRVHEAARQPALDLAAFHHRGVVAVGDHGVLRRLLVGVADHLEHRALLRDAIDRERRVEDLVAAMLAVGLREHHQLDVGRVALQSLERVDQVVDLVLGQRQAEVDVRARQRGTAGAQHVDMRHRLARLLVEKMDGVFASQQHAFGHAVVQQRGGRENLFHGQGFRATQQSALERQPEFHDPLDPLDREPAVVSDVGGLAGPGRHRAHARRDDDQRTVGRAGIGVAVAQERLELVQVGLGQRRLAPGPVHVPRGDAGDARLDGLQPGQQRLGAEGGERIAPIEVKQVLGAVNHAGGFRL